MQIIGSVCKQYRHRFFGRRAGKGFRHCVAPELHAHHANGRGARRIGDAGDINIKGADGEVGIAGRERNEGVEDVGGGVVRSEKVSGEWNEEGGVKYLTKFAQYARARSTSSTEPCATFLRYVEA
jgi:hypothetical protein